ncbi:gliding motility-associated C-terminal domain-containing protein [Danxiaibacter flavus]|uniref:Gliding motility-associated C-terminal domain-containing protein n=1 Tax=Danxiaibacter flavus TaxID=3049108 RepID=A0ABV3ZA68_9BACT|nr:gliding motility-associated C-terminal domain-containing protein [Chitinophagaceae bacterium DXS]
MPICGGKPVPGPCIFDHLTDKNPFWYRFTCFKGGTLGFLITPNTLSEDYDWQLFDITGHDPVDVFLVRSLFVSCNWSGEPGLTGASSNGTQNDVCAGFGKPKFSSMPNLIEGHQYLLLISHFSDSQSGYSLSFGGGTASIIDPLDPALSEATAYCGGLTIRIKVNKKMRCTSLAADGSDFSVSTAAGKIVSATGVSCTTGFDMDLIDLKLSNPLPPGDYTINMKRGADNNTLLDYCDREIPEGSSLKVTVYPLEPTPMDSVKPVVCAPDQLELVFRSPMLCSSIAKDGSDFVVSGPSAVTIKSAAGVCDDQGSTTSIKLQLSEAIKVGGLYTIKLQHGTDGNSIFDVCSKETPVGSSIDLKVADVVNASYTMNVSYGCKQDTVYLINDGSGGVNKWNWFIDSTSFSQQQSPVMFFSDFGDHSITLAVSNGVCSDTVSGMLQLNNKLKAVFEAPTDVCPGDLVTIKNNSIGNITSFTWDFDNGTRSTQSSPQPQSFAPPQRGLEKWYTLSLVVQNQYNCFDTATQKIRALASCFVAVPTAFTPNNDGLNDFLYPLNGYKTTDLEFKVYNRLGQLVFETRNWTNKWDGTYKGNPQPTGTYVWMLTYTDVETKQKYSYKGTSLLMR